MRVGTNKADSSRGARGEEQTSGERWKGEKRWMFGRQSQATGEELQVSGPGSMHGFEMKPARTTAPFSAATIGCFCTCVESAVESTWQNPSCSLGFGGKGAGVRRSSPGGEVTGEH